MQTFKEILSRDQERRNIRNVCFCVLTVCALVIVAFGVVGMKFLVQDGTNRAEEASAATETLSGF